MNNLELGSLHILLLSGCVEVENALTLDQISLDAIEGLIVLQNWI